MIDCRSTLLNQKKKTLINYFITLGSPITHFVPCAHLYRSAEAEFDDDEEFDLSDIEEACTTDIHVDTAAAAGEAEKVGEVGEVDHEEEIVADDFVINEDEVCY